MTSRILALVDGSAYSESVCHFTAWIAGKLGTGVDLLHVIRDGHSAEGAPLRLGSRKGLAEELAAVDAQRVKLALAQGHAILDDAQAIIEAAGVGPVRQRLVQGDLLQAVRVLEPEIRALVIGKRGEGSAETFEHLGSKLERVVRAVPMPVFVASRAFQRVEKVLIAFDASASSERAVERMAASPVFAGLDTVLVHAGPETPALRARMEAAQARLAAAGVKARLEIIPGDPEEALERKIAEEGFGLLVMGAYGHSRIRSLIIGSTTTAMINACKVPVLLYR